MQYQECNITNAMSQVSVSSPLVILLFKVHTKVYE